VFGLKPDHIQLFAVQKPLPEGTLAQPTFFWRRDGRPNWGREKSITQGTAVPYLLPSPLFFDAAHDFTVFFLA